MELETLAGTEVSRRSFMRAGALVMAGAGLALAGCSSSTKKAASGAVAASSDGAASPASSAAASLVRSSASGTVSFLSWDTVAVMQPVVDLFHKTYPKIRVQLEFEDASKYIPTLATRISAGTAPDVFIYTAQNKAALNAGGDVLELTDQSCAKVMAAANRDFMSDSGKVYGFSPASWASGPIWNLDLLDKVGGKPPATWDDLLQIGHELKSLNGVTPFMDAAQLGTMLEGLLGSYFKKQGWLSPGQVLDVDADQRIFSGQSTFQDEWAVPLGMYGKLYTEGLVPSSVVALTGSQIDSEFANGRLGALGSGPWDVNVVVKENPKLNLQMLSVPGANAGEDFWCGAPNQGWAVYSKSKNQDAALAFVNWLATPEALELYNKQSGDIITTTNYQSPVPASLTQCAQAARNSQYYFTGISWPTKYSELLGDTGIAQVNLMIQGKATPTQVLQAMDAEVKKIKG